MNFLLAEMDRLPASSTSTTERISSSSSTPPSPHTDTLVQLCRLWPHLHNPAPDPPPFCQDLLPSGSWQLNPPSLPDIRDRYSTHFGAGKSGERMVGLDLEQTGLQYTGRSLSLISVLGGILVILVIIAFISCYKHRKRVASGESFSVDLFATHIRNMHHLSPAQQLQLLGRQSEECGAGPPPDYETVIKQREEEETGLPTYSVAVERRNTVELKRPHYVEDDYDDIDRVIVEDNDHQDEESHNASIADDTMRQKMAEIEKVSK